MTKNTYWWARFHNDGTEKVHKADADDRVAKINTRTNNQLYQAGTPRMLDLPHEGGSAGPTIPTMAQRMNQGLFTLVAREVLGRGIHLDASRSKPSSYITKCSVSWYTSNTTTAFDLDIMNRPAIKGDSSIAEDMHSPTANEQNVGSSIQTGEGTVSIALEYLGSEGLVAN
ncbi:hypothetical protein IAQ61_002864 [Plenodomus lingam]|nr:hypothetical protein IAQ61_002864 [Plenodomus lingam]